MRLLPIPSYRKSRFSGPTQAKVSLPPLLQLRLEALSDVGGGPQSEVCLLPGEGRRGI